jgi:hypothetical protein
MTQIQNNHLILAKLCLNSTGGRRKQVITAAKPDFIGTYPSQKYGLKFFAHFRTY